MEKIVDEIVKFISDYRNDQGINIDKDHIITWVEQFNKKDRKFLLSELLHILPTSYLSKVDVKDILANLLNRFAENYEKDNVNKFLSKSRFLSCQGKYKSQTVLLKYLSSIVNEKFDTELNYDNPDVKYWIYLDDVIASGGTFQKNIEDKIDDYGAEEIVENDIKIISFFFFLHSWGHANTEYILSKRYGKPLLGNMQFWFHHEIQNDPRINNHNPNPRFNIAYPIKDKIRPHMDEYLEQLSADRNYENAYRAPQLPSTENYYSSRNNRIRYENIILDKGIDIYNRIEAPAPPVRPLGFTVPSNKTFGTGSHVFTWRNISNTCPIVYWWEYNDWYPLFPVNRGGN